MMPGDAERLRDDATIELNEEQRAELEKVVRSRVDLGSVSVSARHLAGEAKPGYGLSGSRMICPTLRFSPESASTTRLRNTGATFHW